jgi:putative membrane-bound dehydrogenase-like protein
MKTSLLWGIALATAAPSAFGQFEQLKTSNAPFLKPEEAVARMEIQDGFQIDIFAAEPDIGEPIAFTFDDRGRIWVVENYNYIDRRNHEDEKPLTRIQIFEDTDSDGVFDVKKLFTDELTFSSGIATGFGGVFVGTPPNLLFIPDADGDDVPDGEPEVLLDGWGIQDRHETLNSFIWGPDGWLYGCHGVFTSSMVGKPGTPDKDRLFIDGGVWRYHPTKKEFEVFARGLSNPWGIDFNDVGQSFVTCCVIPHLFHIVQGGYYHKQSKAHLNPYVYDYIRTIRTHKQRLSAHGGARFYLADTFPPEFRDQLFMCNIHQHQVLTDVMTPSGSSYIGNHGEDFVTTNDLAWVGFSVEIGPDGGVYILDWHDTDICGNKINFPDSGRIYRLMPEGAEPIERPDIGSLSDAELVAMQAHANDWYVRAARLNLQMRAANGTLDPKVGSMLRGMLAKATTSPKRVRALWSLHVTQNLNESQLIKLLDHEDPYVRSFAIQFLCEDKNPSAVALRHFAELAENDSSPVVRLYLAAGLQRMKHDQRWPILEHLAQHTEDAEDNNIPRMLWFALEPMVPLQPEKSLELAVTGKLVNLQEHVARRLVSGDLPPASHRNHERPGLAPNAAQKVLQRVAPGFQVRDVGEGGVRPQPEFRNDFAVQTHPLSRKMPCVLFRKLDVPDGKTTKLHVRASYHAHGDWQLRVLADGEVLHDQIVNYETVQKEWLELEIDLTRFAGESVSLELENRANDWAWEFGFWGKVEIVSEAAPGGVSAR